MTAPIGGLPGRGPVGLDIAGERNRSHAVALPDGSSFADTLKEAIGGVQRSQDNASEYVQRYARGENVELHQVMAATEEASISLTMMVELRNKFADAYRTVIGMQS
ncbi:MAG: Flagellar hook-basal body complex protein fliE [Gemmatimonadetes bacterium]|nr:Flagellar hook-basal body complex protein fliE [Gemmatimonadota bacterium]